MSDNTTPTELIHLTYDGNFELECDAKVLCCRVINDELQAIELDRTTMHPQGGGQPTDVGTISAGGEQTVTISKVTLDRDSGIVTHEGTVTTEPLQVGDHVKVPPWHVVVKSCRQVRVIIFWIRPTWSTKDPFHPTSDRNSWRNCNTRLPTW